MLHMWTLVDTAVMVLPLMGLLGGLLQIGACPGNLWRGDEGTEYSGLFTRWRGLENDQSRTSGPWVKFVNKASVLKHVHLSDNAVKHGGPPVLENIRHIHEHPHGREILL